MPIPNKADLENMKQDIDDLEQIVNSVDSTDVTTRLGKVHKSLTGRFNDFQTKLDAKDAEGQAALATAKDKLVRYAAVNYKGDFVAGTAYEANDVWKNPADNTLWIVPVDYTSSATAQADIDAKSVRPHQDRDRPEVVTSIEALKAITPAYEGQTVLLSDAGRSGPFIWTLGDFIAEVAADTKGGVHVASDSIATSVGCWVRKLDGFIDPKWFDDALSVAVSVSAIIGCGIEHNFSDYDYSSEATIDVPPEGLSVDFKKSQITGAGGSVSLFNITTTSGGDFVVLGSEEGRLTSVFRISSVDDSSELDLLKIKGISTDGELLTYYQSGSPAYIKTIKILDNKLTGASREGLHYRGWWDDAEVAGNIAKHGIEHYAIRLGFDEIDANWHRMGYASVYGNIIHSMYNPETGAGSNECNAIAIFGEQADITLNNIYDINGAGVDDIEGIYTKVRYGKVAGNTLKDACRREGQIVLKEPQPSPVSGSYDHGAVMQVYGNKCSFENNRSHESSISIQRDNCHVFGKNYAEAGDGINAESSGIVLKYRSAYRNVVIDGNDVLAKSGTAGILAWCYGEGISITNNNIYDGEVGGSAYGVRLETRSSSDVRYPTSDTPICKNIIVKDNVIKGRFGTINRALSIAFDSSVVSEGVFIENNKTPGTFGEYMMSISVGSVGTGWNIFDNKFTGSGGTSSFLFSSFPASFRIARNIGLTTKASGSETLSGSTGNKTVATGLENDLGAYLTKGDIQISPQDVNYFDRQVRVNSTFSSGSFTVAGDSGNPNASTFSWKVSLEDRELS